MMSRLSQVNNIPKSLWMYDFPEPRGPGYVQRHCHQRDWQNRSVDLVKCVGWFLCINFYVAFFFAHRIFQPLYFCYGEGGRIRIVFLFLFSVFFWDLTWCQQTFIEKCVKKRFFVEVSKFRKQKKVSKKVNRLFNQVSQRIQVWYIYLHLLEYMKAHICKYTSPMDPMGKAMIHSMFQISVQAAGTTQLYRGSRYSPYKRPCWIA